MNRSLVRIQSGTLFYFYRMTDNQLFKQIGDKLAIMSAHLQLMETEIKLMQEEIAKYYTPANIKRQQTKQNKEAKMAAVMAENLARLEKSGWIKRK
jgi:hypothetical protein